MKRLLGWFGARRYRPVLAAILIIGAVLALKGPPRLERDWHPYLAHAPSVTTKGETFAISPVSDWRYEGESPVAETYIDVELATTDLRRVWFLLEPQPGSKLAAHTLLLFEFEGDRLLGITIEARRERDEKYSPLRGAFNAFELAYVWGTARDLLTRRAVMLGHETFIYPVAIGESDAQALLTRLLDRTHSLETEARYYNTLFSNCTNELAKAAGLNWAPAYILTGRSDEYLFRRGVIPGEIFADAHARSDMTAFVRTLNEAPLETFDAALLAELRRRFGEQKTSE